MKQVLIRKGAAMVADVPAPRIEAGDVLVRVRASCLSVGTEMSGIRHSATPLWKRALQPEQLATVLRTAASQGVRRTWSLIQEKREAAHPTGYSAAGVVEAVGAGVHDLRPGDRVACAGAQYAYHAEFIRVPRNLCTPIPDDLDWAHASTVTLGAIALQGVRRAQPTLGERFVVIGLGILGQLTQQLLRANGCRTIGIDVDLARIALAEQLGLDHGLHPDHGSDIEQVARLTDGAGADGVIITAATASDAVVAAAFKMCRKKARVVLVGDVGLQLNRADFYAKEIDFLISASYGPGRYDHRYEEQGLDYPLAYVRWTENRNMAEYLRLIAEGRVQVEPLISARFPIAEASAAYASLSSSAGPRPMMVLLTFPEHAEPVRTIEIRRSPQSSTDRIRVALLGAGAFARSTHLPNLLAQRDVFSLRAVVTGSGHTAQAVASQFGAQYASTDYEAAFADSQVDAVIIATRHHLHAALVRDALRAGKHVLVEKPLALTAEELGELEGLVGTGSSQLPVLLTGFNRRFSPYARRMAESVARRAAPFIINYRMNAGYLPLDHWVHGEQGGGRNLGEACHIYDLFTYLAGAPVAELSAHSIVPRAGHYARNDNFVATVTFTEGSVATLTYTALGSSEHPKEMADLFVDGTVTLLEDYKRLLVRGGRGGELRTALPEKGHKEELAAFGQAIRSGEWPISWGQQVQATRIALAVESALLNA